VAFVAAGIGTLGLAYAIRTLTVGSWSSVVGSLLLAIYGAGAILVAIFPTDRIDSRSDVWSQSATGSIHIIVALVSFLCGIAGMFILTRRFMQVPQWCRFASWWLMLFPTSALALFVVQGEGPMGGLLQRLLVTVISAWLIVVAFKVRSIATPANT
jgi:hypothetical protein